MVYRILGKLKWGNMLGRADVVIVHRGGPGDRKTIPGREITEVSKGRFVYVNILGEETSIPFHRVLEVRLDGKQIWKRK